MASPPQLCLGYPSSTLGPRSLAAGFVWNSGERVDCNVSMARLPASDRQLGRDSKILVVESVVSSVKFKRQAQAGCRSLLGTFPKLPRQPDGTLCSKNQQPLICRTVVVGRSLERQKAGVAASREAVGVCAENSGTTMRGAEGAAGSTMSLRPSRGHT